MHPANPKILIIIPVYNEATIIREVVAGLWQAGYKNIIVVDDGSSQDIQSGLKGFRVHYLQHKINLGQGAALQTGFSYARYVNPDLVITFDGDGQHIPGDIPTLIKPVLNNEADVVLGSRFLPADNAHIPGSKKIILHLARLINFLFSGLLLTDAHNGLRAFNKTALQKINITENRMAHASEILFEIKKHHLRYTEVPVHIHYTEYARRKGQPATDSLKILFDLVLHKLFR